MKRQPHQAETHNRVSGKVGKNATNATITNKISFPIILSSTGWRVQIGTLAILVCSGVLLRYQRRNICLFILDKNRFSFFRRLVLVSSSTLSSLLVQIHGFSLISIYNESNDGGKDDSNDG